MIQRRVWNILAIFFVAFSVFCYGCDTAFDDFDPTENIYTGKEAESHLTFCDSSQLPASITGLWVFDGGTFNGSIYYVSFQCDSIEDCWRAVYAFGAPDKARFVSGIKTNYAVNQHGPSFYHKGLKHPEWNISSIKSGVFYESASGDDRMQFWAIDLDRMQVYFHYESGGFPSDDPSVRFR